MSKILPLEPHMGSNTTTRNNSAAGCDDDLVVTRKRELKSFQLSAFILGEAEARHSSEIGPLDRGGNPLGRAN
jgi:hypothetical protein